MKRPKRSILATAVALTATPAIALGGTDEKPIIETPPPSMLSPWSFEATAYGWFTGLNGDLGIGGFDVGVDTSFLDIIDDLKFAAALRFEARNGKWGAIVDGFYVDLGTSGNPPGPLYNSASADMEQFMGELSLAYRVYESPSCFVDIYAGARYNSLKTELGGVLNPAGIQTVSNNISAAVINRMEARAEELAQPVRASYKAAAQPQRQAIEDQLAADITAEVDAKVKQDIKKRLLKIRRDNGGDLREVVLERFARSVKAVRTEVAVATAKLEVAQLRASVDNTALAAVTAAEARLGKAQKDLASAIDGNLNKLPTNASADVDWWDPIIGVRAQWNINEKWYLAGKTDIGGFGAGSDLAWTLQATVGYNFTESVSAELGYRYLHTDYSEGNFDYDIAQAGLYTGFNFKF